MEDIIEYYFIYELPYPYKGVFLHPLKMNTFYELNSYINCLMIEKSTSMENIEAVRMSYLDYLFYTDEKNPDYMYVQKLLHLFALIFKEQEVNFYKNPNGSIYFSINGINFLAQDFDNIKQIIFAQYGFDYEDLNVSDAIRKALKDAQDFQSKKSFEVANIEEQLIIYHLKTGFTYEEINNLPIRKFRKAIQRMMIMEDWQIYKPAELHGDVAFKNPGDNKHWFSHIKPRGSLDGLVVKNSDETIQNLKQGLE